MHNFLILTACVFLVGCKSTDINLVETPEQKFQRCGFQKSGNKLIKDGDAVVVVHDPALVDKDCRQ